MRHLSELTCFVIVITHSEFLTAQRRPRKHDLTSHKTVNSWKDPFFQVETGDVLDESQLPLPEDPAAFPVDDGSAVHIGNIDEDLTTFPPEAVAAVVPAVIEAAATLSPAVTVAPAAVAVKPRPVDRPRGPIVREEQLEDKYSTKFTPDAESNITLKYSFELFFSPSYI